MNRLYLAAAIGLIFAGSSPAQCGYWHRAYPAATYNYVVPAYPLGSYVWGAPAPLPLPPAPKPFVPKAGVGVREDSEPVTPKSKEMSKKKNETELKEKDIPRIPKPKLPIPGDTELDKKDAKPPKFETPKKDPKAEKTKTIEQYVVPADENSKPSAEVRVGFFNHSDREITLDVNGEAVKLPSEQYVTVRVARTFTWSEKGQKSTDVVVPPDAEGLEIVFRK